MVRRICPICDQIMKSAHYCRNCKSFVRNPYIRETDYYLNERHPASEEHCSFHDPWEEEKEQKPIRATVSNASPNRQRSINPSVYGAAKDRSEQARQVAAMARGESRKTTKSQTLVMNPERTQTVINGKVVNGNATTRRTTTSTRQRNGGGIPLPVILFIVVILLNTCGRMF